MLPPRSPSARDEQERHEQCQGHGAGAQPGQPQDVIRATFPAAFARPRGRNDDRGHGQRQAREADEEERPPRLAMFRAMGDEDEEQAETKAGKHDVRQLAKVDAHESLLVRCALAARQGDEHYGGERGGHAQPASCIDGLAVDQADRHGQSGPDQGGKRRDDAHCAARKRVVERAQADHAGTTCRRRPGDRCGRRQRLGGHHGEDEAAHQADRFAGQDGDEDARIAADQAAAKVTCAPRDCG